MLLPELITGSGGGRGQEEESINNTKLKEESTFFISTEPTASGIRFGAFGCVMPRSPTCVLAPCSTSRRTNFKYFKGMCIWKITIKKKRSLQYIYVYKYKMREKKHECQCQSSRPVRRTYDLTSCSLRN